VGESGCGKSTFAKVLMGLETATEGTITFKGDEIESTEVQQRPREQVASLQMVFQNPNDTLNLSMTVGGQIGRVIRKFGVETDPDKVHERVMRLLDMVKLPRDFYFRRPRQLSGGQKQRVGVARAFAGNPAMVIADEPVSALDVSVQAQVLNILDDLKDRFGLTYVFISHDLSVVESVSDRVAVMYFGRIVEVGPARAVFGRPRHPYTHLLLNSAPAPGRKSLIPEDAETELPDPYNPPPGCPFFARCPRGTDICTSAMPPLEAAPDNARHRAACYHPHGDAAA
ncbi:MAG: ABC transporter ATP-binding protein, partial [Roseitalea porphyridii]